MLPRHLKVPRTWRPTTADGIDGRRVYAVREIEFFWKAQDGTENLSDSFAVALHINLYMVMLCLLQVLSSEVQGCEQDG